MNWLILNMWETYGGGLSLKQEQIMNLQAGIEHKRKGGILFVE